MCSRSQYLVALTHPPPTHTHTLTLSPFLARTRKCRSWFGHPSESAWWTPHTTPSPTRTHLSQPRPHPSLPHPTPPSHTHAHITTTTTTTVTTITHAHILWQLMYPPLVSLPSPSHSQITITYTDHHHSHRSPSLTQTTITHTDPPPLQSGHKGSQLALLQRACQDGVSRLLLKSLERRVGDGGGSGGAIVGVLVAPINHAFSRVL